MSTQHEQQMRGPVAEADIRRAAAGWRRMAGALALLLGAAAGCARTAPVVAPPAVALNVPPAPPRVISIPPQRVEPVETTSVEPQMDEPLPVRAPRPAPRHDVQRPVQVPVTEGEGAPPTDSEATVAPPAPFTPLLRTPQTADESESDRRIREVLFRASTALTRVNAATLNREARTQHETARRFVEQANQALIERNYVFASYLADKAETLAKGISR